jgi:hypothetical protein
MLTQQETQALEHFLQTAHRPHLALAGIPGMSNWEFRLNEQAAWCWRCVLPDNETIVDYSERDFTTAYLCVRDAEKHGYRVQCYGVQH